MKNIIICVIDIDDIPEEKYHHELSNEEFYNMAKKHSRVYTLESFEEAFNEAFVDTNSMFIRCMPENSIS